MRYLGGTAGRGRLFCAGTDIARASYDFDSYLGRTGEVTSGGEIRLAAGALERIFGRPDVQLLTEDGQMLDLRFSGRALPAGSEVAHVDVTGSRSQLPQRRPH